MDLNNVATMTQRLDTIERLCHRNKQATDLSLHAGNLASKLGLLAGKFNPGSAEDVLYSSLRLAATTHAKGIMDDARVDTARALEAIRRFREDYPDVPL